MKGVIFVLGAICSVMFYGCNQSGCTDPLAANYEVKATTDDGSCVYLAQLGTSPITNVTEQSFNSGGVITSDGGQDVTVRGVCWSTSPNPTTANDTTINGFGTGVFISLVTGLQSGTTYYVRAYAININGTAYGDELSFTTELGIGQTYQGGIIAYLLQPGDPGYDANTPHGIIAAPTDQSTGAQWGCSGIAMGTDSGIGYGAANTTAIVNGCAEAGIAARICDDLVLNGYSDWYLPSIDELELLHQNLHVNGVGGFNSVNSGGYWSSEEFSAVSAWGFSFPSGNAYTTNKYYTNYVRAVRAF